jgi:hypothetical protein
MLLGAVSLKVLMDKEAVLYVSFVACKDKAQRELYCISVGSYWYVHTYMYVLRTSVQSRALDTQ